MESSENLLQTLLHKSLSDHKAVALIISSQNWDNKPFKWFNYLLHEADYVKQIEEVCVKSQGAGINSLLISCKKSSIDWVSRVKGNEKESIKELEQRCEALEKSIANGVDDTHSKSQLLKLRAQLWNRTRREEREWLQKSRLRWFELGDKNTKYFHTIASCRCRSNSLSTIEIGGIFFKAWW
ncbi:hypothetical protein V6N13_080495 [Hibiscus sabdariffa]